MKREPVLGLTKAGGAAPHRFPRVTLLVSIVLLLGGMGLANVLPLPSLPRLSFPILTKTAASSRSPFPDVGDRAVFSLPSNSTDNEPIVERITLKDVSFSPVQVPLWPISSRLGVVSDKGRILLTDPRNDRQVWSGPISEARFTYSNILAKQVLKDSKGRVIWSDIPAPDLFFDKKKDGQAQLTDQRGKLLWSGKLLPTLRTYGTHSDHRGTTYTMEFAGVRVNGINGYFTLVDDTGVESKVLWSGTLPLQPVLLFRDDHRFLFWGWDRSDSGSDRVTNIRLSEEPGWVTVTDARSRVLGQQTIPFLKVDSTVQLEGETISTPLPHQYCVPYGNLAKSGSVLFTYKDRTGRILHKNSVVRDGERQRINNNGLPY
jgi:hypothetical protein